MKAQIPWLRVFVEGVVIVASILMAFGIEKLSVGLRTQWEWCAEIPPPIPFHLIKMLAK